ncbi:L-histidine N(alpha)-methyltransferase [Aneurinibacillus sp. Ricciae_BoGa-3]|uniref:L-histidine N(alpha)-methyltransferase n=1 Tax=Aneurinibacillus sp. Ricciae_BoGa-3 TaxID=3022697 RepID=UPI00233FD5C6|nr:L-histidine N(alpha)-methyltransferase [Aneurinibacillus sp. Ricciae_BoGa-3]WCK56270.1 L-histidine N(alpha)-methyltransferase [Aneurinibacillus sp. Ricciae_BoGa-3]
MTQSNSTVKIYDFYPSFASFKTEILDGLRKPQKEIHAKFFYDKLGSELFEEITMLDEYYPTRTEIFILEQYKKEIASMVGIDSILIEFGSGSSKKIRILLDELPDLTAYMPIDISKEYLEESTEILAHHFPNLPIVAVCADYTELLHLPDIKHAARQVAFFPGSTIGNFEPLAAQKFLRRVSRTLKKGDGMIIGVDLKKDPSVLHAAYNDAKGITAEFNSNLLRRINRELNADFILDNFRHHAFYNKEFGRIEMHLISLTDQTVRVANENISFTKGETIHTENSYKYSIMEFQDMVRNNGFFPEKVWIDPNNLFGVFYLGVSHNSCV